MSEKKTQKSYTLYAALHDDIGEGFIWLPKPDLPPRAVVKISHTLNGCRRTIFCEALQLESNFLNCYNRPGRRQIADSGSSIVLSHWYRAMLGPPGQPLRTGAEILLNIVAANSFWARLRAQWQHPQLVVRVATWLGVIGAGLGVPGLILGAVSIWMSARPAETPASAVLVHPTAMQSELVSIKSVADIAKLSFVNKRCRLWAADGDIDIDQTCLIVRTAAGGLVAVPNEYADEELQELNSQLARPPGQRDKWLARFYEIGGGDKAK